MRRTVPVTSVFAGYSNCSDGAHRTETAQPFRAASIETLKVDVDRRPVTLDFARAFMVRNANRIPETGTFRQTNPQAALFALRAAAAPANDFAAPPGKL